MEGELLPGLSCLGAPMESLYPLCSLSPGQRTIRSPTGAVQLSSDATKPALLQDQTKAFVKFGRQKGKEEERARDYRNHINPSIRYFLLGLSEGMENLSRMGMSPLPGNGACNTAPAVSK